MAKRKGASAGRKPAAAGAKKLDKANPKTPGKAPKGAAKEPAKPPAKPFGDALPNADRQGSPADKNWKPTGNAVTDLATLESQERFLYRLMIRSKAERDLAKAQAKLLMAQAEETSVTDGFPVEDKVKLHKAADLAETKAAKAEKEYKRARDGWNSIKGTMHRYLTEDEPPLFQKSGKAA